MKKVVYVLLILTTLSCKKENIDPEILEGLLKGQVITVDGVDRGFHLYKPPNPFNAPVVLLFHGHGGNKDDLLGLSGKRAPYKKWLEIAYQENIILIVPDGLKGSDNLRGWNDCRNDAASNPTVDDVQFVRSVLDYVKALYFTNDAKVYAMGTSNGGHFVIRLAYEIPDRITAFAAIVASNPVNSKCTNTTTPVSALFMNGTEDPILPYNGGEMASNRGVVYSTDIATAYWYNRNGTDTNPIVTNFQDSNTDDKCTATRYLYPNGQNGTEVALYRINNGGHAEPSKEERYRAFYLLAVGNQNSDIEMADEVWSFFKTKSK